MRNQTTNRHRRRLYRDVRVKIPAAIHMEVFEFVV